MPKLTWLADVLRDAGCTVVEVPGWQGRGGDMGEVKGVLCHHTGSNPKGGDHPALALVRDGRDDLAGPLSHLVLARNGTFHVVAAGRSNHAGNGKWQGLTAGNTHLVGIEAENDGRSEPWPGHQLAEYAKGVAAILKHVGADDVMAIGHKEWRLPKGYKTDPTFDMVDFRENVEAIMGGQSPAAVATPRTVDPARDMLRKGSRGDSVKVLQRALGLTGDDVDGDFGPRTDKLLREFQRKHGLTVDGKAGPKTWAALGG